MTRPLPYRNIRFCTRKEEEILRVELAHHQGVHLENDGNVGWIFEVTKKKSRLADTRKDERSKEKKEICSFFSA